MIATLPVPVFSIYIDTTPAPPRANPDDREPRPRTRGNHARAGRNPKHAPWRHNGVHKCVNLTLGAIDSIRAICDAQGVSRNKIVNDAILGYFAAKEPAVQVPDDDTRPVNLSMPPDTWRKVDMAGRQYERSRTVRLAIQWYLNTQQGAMP